MSSTDKEGILIRVSEFLTKSVNDLADALNTVAKQVTEFQTSLKKVREDLKQAQVTPVTASSVPLLAQEVSTSGPSTNSLFDFLEGEADTLTTAEPSGMAESILLGDIEPAPAGPPTPTEGPPSAPPTAPPTAPPEGPPKAPPKAPPAAPPKAAPKAPPKAAPKAPPSAPPSAPPEAAPLPPAATAAAPPPAKAGEGIATLRTEMMAEIKRIKEIFET